MTAMFLVALACVLFGSSVSRAANRYSMISVHPNQDLGHYFFIQESETLPRFKWNLGMMMLYYNELLNIKWESVIVGPGGRRIIRVDERHGIDNLVYDYFYGAIGLADWMTLAVDFPLFLYYQYGRTTANVASNTTQYFKPGDIWLSAKFRLLDIDKHAVGVALIPSVSFPTGKDSQFLGDQGVTGQGKIVIEVKPTKKFRAALNIAFQTRERVVINDISFRNTIKFGLGAAYDVVDNVSIIGELASHTVTNDFYGSRRTSPAEARIATRWRPGGGNWSVGGGGSVGIVEGVGMPRFGLFASVGYSMQIKRREPVEPSKFEDPASVDQCVSLAPDDGTKTDRYLVLCEVFFGFDESETEDPRAILGIVDLIKRARGNVEVEIRGWTDEIGTKNYNRGLSMRRAEYVAKAIADGLGDIRNKVDIHVLGIGEDSIAYPDQARRADTLLK